MNSAAIWKLLGPNDLLLGIKFNYMWRMAVFYNYSLSNSGSEKTGVVSDSAVPDVIWPNMKSFWVMHYIFRCLKLQYPINNCNTFFLRIWWHIHFKTTPLVGDNPDPKYSFLVSHMVLKQEILCWSSCKKIAMWTDWHLFTFLTNQKQEHRLDAIGPLVVKKWTKHKPWLFYGRKCIFSIPKFVKLSLTYWLK